MVCALLSMQIFSSFSFLSHKIFCFSPPLLHLNGFEVDSGVDIFQLTVKGMKRGPFGSLRVPAFQHDAVDVRGAVIWTR